MPPIGVKCGPSGLKCFIKFPGAHIPTIFCLLAVECAAALVPMDYIPIKNFKPECVIFCREAIQFLNPRTRAAQSVPPNNCCVERPGRISVNRIRRRTKRRLPTVRKVGFEDIGILGIKIFPRPGNDFGIGIRI